MMEWWDTKTTPFLLTEKIQLKMVSDKFMHLPYVTLAEAEAAVVKARYEHEQCYEMQLAAVAAARIEELEWQANLLREHEILWQSLSQDIEVRGSATGLGRSYAAKVCTDLWRGVRQRIMDVQREALAPAEERGKE